MAKTGIGWVITTRDDRLREYWASNTLQRTVYRTKVCLLKIFFGEIISLVRLDSTFTTIGNAL